jgi:chromosome segregation ATPase
MNSSPELLLSLQEYIVELETENRSLKQHIFQLQNKLEAASSASHDDIEKLKVYIDHCENEILKRENREVGMLDLVRDIEENKEEICRERDIYIQEIEELRRDVLAKQEEVTRLQRQEENYKTIALQSRNIQNLPPKSGKCKNCETYIKNQQLLQQQLKEYSENISSLQLDIHCLQEFI